MPCGESRPCRGGGEGPRGEGRETTREGGALSARTTPPHRPRALLGHVHEFVRVLVHVLGPGANLLLEALGVSREEGA